MRIILLIQLKIISFRRSFPTPKTQKNVRQFLGKIKFYNGYIPTSAIILDPLNNLFSKNQPFIWSDQCQKAFEKIEALLCSQSVLAIFDKKKIPIKIYTDASIEGVLAILKQTQTGGKNTADLLF